MNKETLEKEIENYIRYYYGIKKSFDLYKYIKENSVIYPKETQQIAYFLKPVLVSLLNNTLLDMSKILDCRNQKNINKLIEVCVANVKLFCNNPNNIKEKNEKLKLFKELKEEIEKNTSVIENLKTYRDVLLAHTDKKYFMEPKKLFEEYKTTYEELEKLLNLIVDSLNKLLSCLCQTTFAFDTQYKDSYKYILECIKECRENRLNKYKKEG